MVRLTAREKRRVDRQICANVLFGLCVERVESPDKESCCTDFAVAIYPGHLSLSEDGPGLNPDIGRHISRQTPPTFLLQNEDDGADV
jgi:hypothetical protein